MGDKGLEGFDELVEQVGGHAEFAAGAGASVADRADEPHLLQEERGDGQGDISLERAEHDDRSTVAHEGDAFIDGGGGPADGLDDGVDGKTLELLAGGLAVGEDGGGAEGAGHLGLKGVAGGYVDLGGAGAAGHERVHEADGAGAEDDGARAEADAGLVDGVNGDGDGLGEGAILGADAVGQGVDRGGGREHRLGHATGAVATEEDAVLAVPGLAGEALVAAEADGDGFDGNVGAHLELDTFADSLDDAANLVAGSVHGGTAATVAMQVASADAGAGDPQPHPTGRGIGQIALNKVDGTGGGPGNSAHGAHNAHDTGLTSLHRQTRMLGNWDHPPGAAVTSEQDRGLLAFVAGRMRNLPAFSWWIGLSYWFGLTTVVAAALGVLVMFAILVNPLTSVLAGVIVVALGLAVTGGVTRHRRLPPETLFYAALALIPLFIALALIAIIT